MFLLLIQSLFKFLILPIICVTILLHLIAGRQYKKWQRMGIAYDKPKIPFTSALQFCLAKRPFGLIITDIYERFQDKFVGVFILFKAVLVVRDTELARRILTTDSASFYGRGMHANNKHPITENLMTLEGQKWRNLRVKLTPAFSSGQMKGMFATMDKMAQNLIDNLAEELEDGRSHILDIKKKAGIYAVDIIGSIIFGLDINSFAEPNNEFRDVLERAFITSNIVQKMWLIMNFVWPPILKCLTFLGLPDRSALHMREIIMKIITFRETHKQARKDTLHLMLQMTNAELSQPLSLDTVASNSLIMYIAGSESIASAAAYLVYELALNPEICKKAQNEVDQCLKEHDLESSSAMTYAALEDMSYLDLCLKETLRKYPGLPFLNRECKQNYLVPGTDFTIEKGTSVLIPLLGIHRDPENFPEPLKFIPERFSNSENLVWNRGAYMPFGEGPRLCIAKRMGVLDVKLVVAKILANFNIEPEPIHKELEFTFFSLPVLVPKYGIQVRFSKRW